MSSWKFLDFKHDKTLWKIITSHERYWHEISQISSSLRPFSVRNNLFLFSNIVYVTYKETHSLIIILSATLINEENSWKICFGSFILSIHYDAVRKVILKVALIIVEVNYFQAERYGSSYPFTLSPLGPVPKKIEKTITTSLIHYI